MSEIEKKEVYPFEHGMSPVTAKLIDKLKTGKVADILTDMELEEHCGRDTRVTGNGYGNLMTAIRHTTRRYDLVWARIKGENALRCLGSKAIAEGLESDIKRTGKRMKWANIRASLVKLDELGEDLSKRFIANKVITGTIKLLTKKTTLKKLMASSVSIVDPRKLLESFKKIA